MPEDVNATVERLLDTTELGSGLQISCVVDGETRAWSWGQGTNQVELRVGDLFDVYCALKPLLGLVAGHLVDAGLVSLDVELSDLLPRYFTSDQESSVTLADLLAHRCSLDKMSATTWRMTPVTDRLREANQALVQHDIVRVPAYSEVLAGVVLSEIVTRTTGALPEKFVVDQILSPLGVDNDIVILPSHALAERRRVQVPVAHSPEMKMPLLSVAMPGQVETGSLCFGGLANATGLATLLEAVRRAFAGEAVPGMPTPSTTRRLLTANKGTYNYGDGFAQACTFSGSFMVDLRSHGISAAPPDSFGHTSGVISAFSICSPKQKMVVAGIANGIVLDSLSHSRVRSEIYGAGVRLAQESR